MRCESVDGKMVESKTGRFRTLKCGAKDCQCDKALGGLPRFNEYGEEDPKGEYISWDMARHFIKEIWREREKYARARTGRLHGVGCVPAIAQLAVLGLVAWVVFLLVRYVF